MKLKFKHQRFQADAAKSVTDIFTGQQYCDSADFLVDQGVQKNMYAVTGFGNQKLMLDRESLTENVRQIQMNWGLKPVDYLQGDASNPMFTIEMETGTGKTYTYIKTMYELNMRYGWSKFIIVVPSIAIREGVQKSFETMQEHFADEYGKRIQFFVYNSKQLSKIDSFASDSGLHVMIINTQAFNSSMNEDKNQEGRSGDAAARIIFSKRDEFGSRRPIDILAQTHPIMIIDEPQSVLGANKANATRRGIAKFNPLFTLLYSATHRKEDVYNMVYRLDAMDAYNRKLVKKIEVKGISQQGSTATNGFVYLDEIVIGQGNPQARISFDVKTANGFKQITKLVGEGFNLYEQSGELAEYDNHFIVESIDGVAGSVCFLNGITLHEGDAIGKVNEDTLRRIQIRETIRTHIERERELFSKGIKVLSLFFIDHVNSYRLFEKGGVSNGKFADMFEEEYRNVLQEMQPRFTDEAYVHYLNKFPAEKVHQGYFSQDKKGVAVDSKEKEGDNEIRAYDLIMKNKERLLSFEESVRFIFSHSALKEGWDNPNVFQICTLKDTGNEIKKRQEVGRGMRLCVNKDGERQDQDVLGEGVFDVNILTVIASESYEHFSKQFQTELAEDVADRPIQVTAHLFEDMLMVSVEGEEVKVNRDLACEIHEMLVTNGYVKKGKLTEKYFNDRKAGIIDLGEELNPIKAGIISRLDIVFNPDRMLLDNARKSKVATFREELFKEKFTEVWKRINVKTYYRVDFSTGELIKRAITSIDKHLSVTEIRVVIESGSLENIRDKESLQAGAAMTAGKMRTIRVSEAVGNSVRYDLVGDLVSATGLTRKTIVEILKGIKPTTFAQFRMNPEEFIIKTANIINDAKAIAVIQKIAYERSTNTYDMDIFTENTIRGKLGINAMESAKSLYDIVVVDSLGIEKNFAETLEKEDAVEVYTKLPRGFYINTPMGHYNPDWAIAFKEGSVKHIYFIAETKGNDWQESQLRGVEDAKIECARRHFATISDSKVVYGVAKDYQTLYNLVAK